MQICYLYESINKYFTVFFDISVSKVYIGFLFLFVEFLFFGNLFQYLYVQKGKKLIFHQTWPRGVYMKAGQ